MLTTRAASWGMIPRSLLNPFFSSSLLLFFSSSLLLFFSSSNVFAQSLTPPLEHWFTEDGRINPASADPIGNMPFDAVEWSFSIIQTSDGGYLSAGFTTLVKAGQNTDPASASTVPALTKLSPHGETQWIRYFDEGEPDRYGFFFQVIEAPDGFVAVGRKRYSVSSPTNCSINIPFEDRMILVKVDIEGNTILTDSKALGCGTYGLGIQAVPSGGFIATGFLAETINVNDDSDAFLMKLDNNFTEEWLEIYGDQTSMPERGNKVVLSYDSQGQHDGYVMAADKGVGDGETIDPMTLPSSGSSLEVRDRNAWIIKTDLTGSIVWETEVDASALPNSWYNPQYTEPGSCSPGPGDSWYRKSEDRARHITRLSNGGYAVSLVFNLAIIKYDSNWACTTTPPSGNSFNHGEYRSADIGLLILDEDGNQISNTNIAHFSGDDWVPQVKETAPNEVVVIGTSAYNGNLVDQFDGIQDPMLIKVTDIDQSTPNIAWRKSSRWSQSGGMCGFSVDVCNDGGYVISGNNTNGNENWQFLKLYSDCQVNVSTSSTDITAPLPISGVITWSSPRKVLDEVRVLSGGRLTISSTEIQFGDTRQLNNFELLGANDPGTKRPRIVVEPGGTLIVHNSTLRGLDACAQSNMWEGIVLLGDPQADEHSQGQVFLHSSTIEDAIMAVRVGEARYNWRGHVYTTANQGGGTLNAFQATFRNCLRGIHFSYYPYSAATLTQSASYVRLCTFETTHAMTDPDFVKVDSDLTSNLHGVRLGNRAYMTFWYNHGIPIKGCLFDNQLATMPEELRGVGIGSIDASFSLQRDCAPQGSCNGPRNEFRNLWHGVSALNGGGINAVRISRSIFRDCMRGVRMIGIDQPSITRNEFFIPTNATQLAYGAYLYESDAYLIEGNSFSASESSLGSSLGLWVQNDNDIHNQAFNEVYRNSFDKLFMGSTGSGQNRGLGDENTGLIIKCNDYDNGRFDIVSSLAPGIGKFQGRPQASDPQDPAGNRFDGCFGAVGEIIQVPPLELIYTHHDDPPTTPDPACVFNVDVQNSNLFFEATEACPTTFPNDNDDYGPLREIRDSIKALDELILEASNSEEADYYAGIRTLQVQHLSRAYLSDSLLTAPLDSLIALWQGESGELALARLIPAQIQVGDFGDAEASIQHLSQFTGWQDFCDLQDIRLDWAKNGGNIYDMENDPELDAQLALWATDSSSSASIYARAMREWVLDEAVQEVLFVPIVPEARQAFLNKESTNPDVNLQLFPNPTSEQITIKTYIKHDGKVEIWDMLGHQITAFSVGEGENSYEVKTSHLSAGIYLCRLLSANQIIETQRLVIR